MSILSETLNTCPSPCSRLAVSARQIQTQQGNADAAAAAQGEAEQRHVHQHHRERTGTQGWMHTRRALGFLSSQHVVVRFSRLWRQILI